MLILDDALWPDHTTKVLHSGFWNLPTYRVIVALWKFWPSKDNGKKWLVSLSSGLSVKQNKPSHIKWLRISNLEMKSTLNLSAWFFGWSGVVHTASASGVFRFDPVCMGVLSTSSEIERGSMDRPPKRFFPPLPPGWGCWAAATMSLLVENKTYNIYWGLKSEFFCWVTRKAESMSN